MSCHINKGVEQTDARECCKRNNGQGFFNGRPILPESRPANGQHDDGRRTPTQKSQHKRRYILIDGTGHNEVATPHQRGQYSQSNAFNSMLLVAQNAGKCTGRFAVLLPKENIIRKANDGTSHHQ